ncbi:MAG: PleD family two-component system response regulator [Alphaproteobacteria bacterium]|nr:PleD family two-component system response regulator [Alphaproteobacteria bacterium]
MSARVLVVDDTPVNVKLLEAKLLVEYYEVLTAIDGPSALVVAEDHIPDIILLDVMMPGMDGYEVCSRLKSNPVTAHIPVVMVTALNEVRDRVRGLEVGADDFLTKPVNDVALFARIRSLVRLKRASDEWRAREATAVELGVTDAAQNGIDQNAPGSVLVVAEGMYDRDLVTETLSFQGHAVELAENDEQALSLAKEKDYDLVLISDGNRDQDALRLCSQMRSEPETRHRPILIMVADNADGRLAKALELGVNDYLVRPIERDELISRSRTQISRRRYEERLRENYTFSVNAAVTDSLTGMYNRRYLESHFERINARMAEVGKPISALILDIDHFKNVNDTHGHEAGDEILQIVAKRIQSNLRGFDTAVRLGGEEFVVLLPDSSLAAAAAAAERLCLSISETPIVVSSVDAGLDITVSIGVACFLAGESGLENMLRHADAALYEAKRTGRNKVMIANACTSLPDPGEPVHDTLPSPERSTSPERVAG